MPLTPPNPHQPRAQARIDLAALRSNVAALRARVPQAQLMAVVKADAYGHGLIPCARAAQQAGASWLGTALISEAIELRQAGLTGPILGWLRAPGDPDLAAALTHDIDLAAYAPWSLAEIAAAARSLGMRARVHLKIDTGLSRGGAAEPDWTALVEAAAVAQREGSVEVVGIFSHLVAGEDREGAETVRQIARFTQAIDQARAVGINPQVSHLANSGGVLTAPEQTAFDLVRCGISMYGLLPDPALGEPADWGLTPVMTLTARLALVKQLPAGQGVSYNHTYHTPVATTVAVVPLGYADGIPRAASNTGPMWVAGARRSILGRVCMDQVVIDLGEDHLEPGTEVVVFGTGEGGTPTAAEWAQVTGTIAYEITTRLGPRVVRTYMGEQP